MATDSNTAGGKHTPTPWEARFTHPATLIRDKGQVIAHMQLPKSVASIWRVFEDKEGHHCSTPIADVHYIGLPDDEALAEQQANAAVIVEAVNAHESLTARVAKLEEALQRLGMISWTSDEYCFCLNQRSDDKEENHEEECQLARAALARKEAPDAGK